MERSDSLCNVLLAITLSVGLATITVAAATAREKSDWDKHIEAARKASQSGEYVSAQLYLKEALHDAEKFNPDDPRIANSFYELGLLELKLQNYASAKEALEKAVRIHEKFHGDSNMQVAESIYQEAVCCQQMGEQAEAEVLLKRVESIYKNSGVPSLDPKWSRILPSLAVYATQENKPETAESCYLRLIEIFQNSNNREQLGLYLNLLASTLGYEGKFGEAKDYARRALEVLKKNSESTIAIDSAQDNLGIIMASSDEKNRDIQIAQNGEQQKDIDYQKQMNKTIQEKLAAELAQQRAERERLAAKEKSKNEEQEKLAFINPGDTLIRSVQFGGVKKSQSTGPSVLPPWQSAKAIKKIEHKTLPSAGVRYFMNGHQISQEEYKASLLANQAYNAIHEEKYQMAVDLLNKAVETCPDLAMVHVNLGLALSRLGKTEDAVEHFRAAVALEPGKSAAWLNLASCFQSSGKLKESVLTFNEYLRRFPNDSLATKARELVKKLQVEANEQEAVKKLVVASRGTNDSDYFVYTTAGGTIKWANNRIPVKVYLASASEVPGYKPEYQGIMLDSFKAWETVTQEKLKFTYVNSESDADIACIWTNDYANVSSPAEGGEAQVTSNQNGISKVRIVILTVDPTPDSPLTTNQVQEVCLHEIGHSLGLSGHSPKPGDIMYCSMSPASARMTLSQRDINTIRHLYEPDVHIALKSRIRQPLDMHDKNSVNNEGVELMSSHAYARAINMFETALKLDPNYDIAKENLSNAYNNYAIELSTKGKEQEALTFMQKAVRLQTSLRNIAAKVKSTTMHNYAIMLRKMHKESDAQKVETEANALESQQAGSN